MTQLPPHGYVMSDECPGFRINNSTDGNLTKGWVVAPGSKAGPCGGPSVRWAPEPGNSSRGYYYRITGGHHVALARSRDLRDPWQSVTMIEPTPEDANIAPYAGGDLSSRFRRLFDMHTCGDARLLFSKTNDTLSILLSIILDTR